MHLRASLSRPEVIGVNLQQTIQVDDDLEITAYYAGHVRACASGLSLPR